MCACVYRLNAFWSKHYQRYTKCLNLRTRQIETEQESERSVRERNKDGMLKWIPNKCVCFARSPPMTLTRLIRLLLVHSFILTHSVTFSPICAMYLLFWIYACDKIKAIELQLHQVVCITFDWAIHLLPSKCSFKFPAYFGF